eukprot:TRINITY_DN2315_c0_g5_i1.p1 TRINITY_DN2315_c0_g5~~TRINITY_DN2315_c0_g5_i1.p1  ORF type:complete len:356 (-),score=87.79 TRINITY_DN2315_c0_g5_i1:105-1172(-)
MMWVTWGVVGLWVVGWVCYCKYQQRRFAKQLERMDPEKDYNRMVMLLCGHELPLEFFLGINLAFYRTFVSPTISGRYYATKAIEHHTLKRVDDTDILMHAWCDYGTESELAKGSFQQLNRIHGFFDISNRDFVFVLCCFVVDTIRMTELTGRREMTPNEKQAHYRFWMDVGKKMNLTDLPKTLRETFEVVEGYVNSDKESRETTGGKALTDAVTNMNVKLYPFIPSAFVHKATEVLLYEVGGPTFYRKLGFKTEPTATQLKCFEIACGLRRFFLRTFTCPRFYQHRLSENLMKHNYHLPLNDPNVFKNVGPEYLMSKLRAIKEVKDSDEQETETAATATTSTRMRHPVNNEKTVS